MTPIVITIIICITVILIVFLVLVKCGILSIERTAKTVSNDIKDAVAPLTAGGGDVLCAIADKIRASSKELSELRARSVRLAQEIEMLKARRVEVSYVKNILQLALLEADMQVTDVRKIDSKEWSSRSGGSLWLSKNSYRAEYLGVLRVSYKQRLGVDIAKLKFSDLGNKRIGVYGLGVIESVGLCQLRFADEVREIRVFKDGKFTALDPVETVDLKNTEISAHRDAVLDTVNSSKTTRNLDAAVERMAMTFMSAFFQPTGYQLVKLDEEPISSVDISGVCVLINNETDEKISLGVKEREASDRAAEEIMQGLLMQADEGRTHV